MNQSVQEVVTTTLKGMGIHVASSTLLCTFALAEGRPVAEKFYYDGGYAVWNVGRGGVDFYDEDGGLLRSVVVEVTDEGDSGVTVH
jgi:hypothetical protein